MIIDEEKFKECTFQPNSDKKYGHHSNNTNIYNNITNILIY